MWLLGSGVLIGEADSEEDQKTFEKAIRMNILTVVAGGIVFVASKWERIPLLEGLLENTISILALILASISLP